MASESSMPERISGPLRNSALPSGSASGSERPAPATSGAYRRDGRWQLWHAVDTHTESVRPTGCKTSVPRCAGAPLREASHSQTPRVCERRSEATTFVDAHRRAKGGGAIRQDNVIGSHEKRGRFVHTRRHSLSWIAAAILLWIAVGATAAPPTKQAPASYEGLVKPGRSVVMKAPVEERVSRIAVAEASVVSEGTILAVMDRRVQEAVVELASWRAANAESVTFAELDLREAELRLQQVKEAFEAEAANELELQTARIERDRAAAKLREAKRKQEQARLELELERRRLERHEVTAPFDAVVKRIRGEVGASLRQGEPILELVAVDPLEAEIYLPAGLVPADGSRSNLPPLRGRPGERGVVGDTFAGEPGDRSRQPAILGGFRDRQRRAASAAGFQRRHRAFGNRADRRTKAQNKSRRSKRRGCRPMRLRGVSIDIRGCGEPIAGWRTGTSFGGPGVPAAPAGLGAHVGFRIRDRRSRGRRRARHRLE